MKLKTFILTFLMMSCSIMFGQGTSNGNANSESRLKTFLANDEYGTITIVSDFSVTSTIEIPQGRKITIDLNGHTLSTNNSIYTFRNQGLLTIKDSQGKGTIKSTLGIYNGKPQTRTTTDDINYGAQLTIESGVFNSTSEEMNAAAIYNYFGVLTIKGGEFYGEYSGITNYGSATIANAYIECLNRDKGAAAIRNDFEIEYGENVRIVGEYKTITETGVILPAYPVVYEPTYLFAELNGTKYQSLQAALDACTTGDNTINLLYHNSEDATVSQKEGVNITIDGNGYKDKQFEYTGTIYVNGNSRHTGTETLTIQDVNFVTTDNEHDFISCNDGGDPVIRYAHNVTVQNCNFNATKESTAVVALRFRQSYNINVVGGTFTNLHSVMWATGTSNATVDGITATNCKEGGISFGTSTPVTVKNSTIEGAQYGVRADGSGAYSLTVDNSTLKAKVPVIVRNTTGEYNLTVKDNATLEATNNGPQVVVTEGKGSDNADYVVPTSDVNVTLYDNVTSTFGLTAKIGNAFYATLQDAVDNAKTGETVTLIADNCTEDVTVTQAPNYAITIDGANKTFKGTITVDGKSSRYETTALTIKKVNFDATEGITYDACVRLGGVGDQRYTNHVTVENCTFTDNDYTIVAVKSYTGGDKNLVIKDCEANGMHSLAQLKNIEEGLVISGNTANTKNGINLNQTYAATIENNIINVQGYAVRAGVDGSNGGNITLTENTLKTDNTEGDPVIELRGTVVALNMNKNVVSGDTHIKGTANTISADENYWDGKEAPVVAAGSAPIVVNSYYSDEALNNLVRNKMGSINAFVLTDRITGEVTSNAKESIKIEIIGEDGNVIGTSSCEKAIHMTGFNNQLTWLINLGADNSDSWAMTWKEGNPSIKNMPAKVKLYVDAVENDEAVAEAEIKYVKSGDLGDPIFAAKTDAEGKINSFIACTGEFNLNNANKFLQNSLVTGDNVAILVAGTYAVPDFKNLSIKDLTITGAVDGVEFDNIGAKNMYGANVTFNNVTFDYYPNVNYTGLQHSGNLVYNNCTFNGQVFLYGTSETFNNCTFNQTSSDAYNVWTYGAKEVAFNECTFNSAGKSVLIYSEDKNLINNVEVTKCEFIASTYVEGKAAIEMNSEFTAGINLTIDGETTAKGFDEGNVSGNKLWNNKMGNANNANNDITVVVAGEKVLEPIYVAKIGENGHRTLQEAISAVKDGETIELLTDCDETVHINKTNVAFTIDGKISETEKVDYSGVIEINIGQNVTIKNIDFTGATTNHDFIKNSGSPTNKNYNTTLLVENCSFEGNSEYDVVGIRTTHPLHTQIVDCTADGLHSLLQNSGGQKITVDNVVITNGKEGGVSTTGTRVIEIKDSDITANGYGVRIDAATADAKINIESSKFNAYIPIYARNATAKNVNFTITGENQMTQTNNDNVWFVIEGGNNKYHEGDKSLEELTIPTGQVSVTLNDTGLDRNGIYGNYGVAKIGKATYNTFADALNAVQDGETIEVLDFEGSEAATEIEFNKDIEFNIAGTAPNYILPIVTFQKATVNIADATIKTAELDARQNATINVKNSTVYSGTGNPIVKSYFNGRIIIDNSTVYTHQATTMGYIDIINGGKLNVTWQTNIYGNGLITIEGKDSELRTAAFNITGEDYKDRDNTDEDRVGKPATVIVDGATLIAGNVDSASGADYSYETEKYGINVGTEDGKYAILDIKNGATVEFYMRPKTDSKFKNPTIGANGTVNIDGSTFNVKHRNEGETLALVNNGVVNVTGEAKLDATVTGDGWFYMNEVALDADTKLLGAKVRFAKGENTVDGATIDDGFFQVGIGAYNGTDDNVDTENGVIVNVKNNAKIGSNGATYAGWVGTGFYDTDAEKAAVMTDAKYVLNIENSIAEFGYLHVSNDGDLNVKGNATEKAHYNNSDYSFRGGDFIINGTATFDATDVLALYTKVSCDNGTNNPGTVNIINGTVYEAELHNGAVAGENFILYKTGVVNANATLLLEDLTSIAADAKLNIGGAATALGTITNNGAINFTSETATLTAHADLTVNNKTGNNDIKVVYEGGTYKFVDKHYVAEIVGGAKYESLAEAATAAQNGETIQLLWNEGDEAISMAATLVGNKTVTITGTADVDWDKGWLYVGRNGEGNGKLIFNEANLTSKSVGVNGNGTGLNVSCKNDDDSTTNDGEVEIINSNIQLDYLIGKGNIKLDNSTLNVYEGFAVGARPATETGGVQRTVTIDITNGSKVIVDNHNGMGLGYEAIGIMNIDETSTFETTQSFLITANGTMNNAGTVNITDTGTLTNNGTINFTSDVAMLKAQEGLTINYDLNPDKKVVYVDGDGVYKVVDKVYVAQIGENKYESLQEAVDEVAEGETIVLIDNIEQADGVIITDKKNIIIDLNDKTFTVTEGASTNNRNFMINGTSVVTIKNGIMVAAGNYTSGAYGTVRTEGTANVTLDDLKLYNYRGNGLNIKAYQGTIVNISNTEIYSEYGGGIEAAGGTINIAETVKVEQKGMYTAPYNSMAISVNSGGTVTVAGGTYSTECITAEEANNQGSSHGPWVVGVLNSGGTLIINGGTFSNDNFGDNSLAKYARGAVLADSKANVQINGGTFNALAKIIDIQNNLGDAANNPVVTLKGGTYSAVPTNDNNGNKSNCIVLAQGYIIVENQDGTHSVVENQVAKIGDVTYKLLQEAIDAAQDGDEIVVLKDIVLTAGVTVADDDNTTIDLNGKTISMQDASGKAVYAIKNNGNLTIKDSAKDGKITFNSTTPDNSFGYSTSTIGNGGNLTIENGIIENTTDGGASYAIDGIWHNGEASLTINDGTILANKVAVRQVPFSATAKNTVTINGGDLNGATAGLQMFNINSDAKLSETIIKGGTFGGTYGFYTSFTSAKGSALATINIDGGTFNGYVYVFNGQNGSVDYPMTVAITDGLFNNGISVYTKDANGNEVSIKAITGGIFSVNPSEYCAENYGAIELADKTWFVRMLGGTQTREFAAGWHWFSTYIQDMEGKSGLESLKSGLDGKGKEIKSQHGVTRYYKAYNTWTSGLTSLSSAEMYMINTAEDVTVEFKGSFVEYENRTINLVEGWNWIGYPVNQELDINVALKNLQAKNGDYLKGKNEGEDSYFIEGFGWYPSFNLQPGHGYMYQSTQITSFEYNAVGSENVNTNVRGSVANNYHWNADATQYPNNMTMVAVVDGLADNEYEVAAFVNGEVRGSARPIYFEPLDAYILVLKIHGNDVEEMTFKCYDLSTNTEYELNNRINYSNDAIVGSINEPYMLTRGTTGIGEASSSEISIYPNPTTTGTEINLHATCDKVEVFNALGVKVIEYQNVDSIDALETAGIYVIRITNNGNVQNCRLVVK